MNKVKVLTQENEFTEEIERIFTKNSTAVNVNGAEVTVLGGAPEKYGIVRIKGSKDVNVRALDRRLSGHYVANVTPKAEKDIQLQISPER